MNILKNVIIFFAAPNAPKANEDTIKARKDILQHFIKSNPKLELQALYAIQSLMTKLEHPSGMYSDFFEFGMMVTMLSRSMVVFLPHFRI